MTLRRCLALFLISVLALTSSASVLAAGSGPKGPTAIEIGSGPQSPVVLAGTGFTYQGELHNGSGPVTATCSFQFSLFNAFSGGAQVGATQTVSNVSVSNGRFTVILNDTAQFGARAFDGSARWLAVAVKCPPDPGFTPLAPRQPLTPAPLALALPGLRTEPNDVSPNLIGGYISNTVTAGAIGATIGGGGVAGFANTVTDSYGTVSGGGSNTAGLAAVVGGGEFNTASTQFATVGGGDGNTAGTQFATVSGGNSNTASGDTSAIGGGYSNTVSGLTSAIAGGWQNTASGDYAFVGGGVVNTASGPGAFVGGGGFDGASVAGNTAVGPGSTIGGGLNNTTTVDGLYTTIGGGVDNTASGLGSAIAGGWQNTTSDAYAFVGGGIVNTASGAGATIGGGGYDGTSFAGNTAAGAGSTIGGGLNNNASGNYATVPGGQNNTAHGTNSFAAGDGAHAVTNGSFVWADSTGAIISSTVNNQFVVRASGGVTMYTNAGATIGAVLPAGSGSWAIVSDRNMKANFDAVDGLQVLNALAGIPIETWNYKTQDAAIRHMGPMAQDFHAAFGVGENDTTISVVDAQGVAFAAIQGLFTVVQQKDAQISTLRDASASQQAQIAALSARVTALESGTAGTAGQTAAGHAPGTNTLQLLLVLMAGFVAGGGLCLGAFALGRARRL